MEAPPLGHEPWQVCDLTKSICEDADHRGFIKSPDGQGYFWYNPTLKTYIEMISFDKLLQDAKQRNHALFKKLKLL